MSISGVKGGDMEKLALVSYLAPKNTPDRAESFLEIWQSARYAPHRLQRSGHVSPQHSMISEVYHPAELEVVQRSSSDLVDPKIATIKRGFMRCGS